MLRFIFILFSLPFLLFSKTSLIIPCYYKHVEILPSLFSHIEKQTLQPDEVVISISQCHRANQKVLADIEKKQTPFKLIIRKSPRKLYAGENRNYACCLASGDLFICQDADDIPHPRRIEILSKIYEKKKFDLLIHQYWHDATQIVPIPANTSIAHFIPQTFSHMDANHIHDYHYGNIAISKSLFKKLQWTRKSTGEDYYFCSEAFSHTNKILAVRIKLLSYNQKLSSIHDQNNE